MRTAAAAVISGVVISGVVISGALLLGGCAADVSLSDRLAGADRVHGDRNEVTVSRMGSQVESLPLAVGHCARFHRSAQFARKAGGSYVFSCVDG